MSVAFFFSPPFLASCLVYHSVCVCACVRVCVCTACACVCVRACVHMSAYVCVCVCMCVCILNCLHEFFFFLQAWFNAKHVFRPSFEVTTHALGCTTKLQNATAKLTLVLWSVAFLNTIKIITAHIYIYIYI